METFGQRLKFSRKKVGFTQKELSKKTGIDQGNLSKMEKDKKFCSIQLFSELCKTLNVSMDWLWYGEEK